MEKDQTILKMARESFSDVHVLHRSSRSAGAASTEDHSAGCTDRFAGMKECDQASRAPVTASGMVRHAEAATATAPWIDPAFTTPSCDAVTAAPETLNSNCTYAAANIPSSTAESLHTTSLNWLACAGIDETAGNRAAAKCVGAIQ
ncbi:hypothetical protein [Rhodanobacter sp. MP7CTX1]|uniref:hypothetical protein n=1 Tax=Rhodanobacter sp. MP7CTX1 TaxID=2723084 RepID=UPI0016218923|nr:hypothetical protein [Rhodanobacter sp. MP7CTX1]MBB6188655.1 hypothetical protein [Rhodanobacter sp. MP7CTX1]